MLNRAMLLHCLCESGACTCRTPDGETVKLPGIISAGKYREDAPIASNDANAQLSPIRAAAQSDHHATLLKSVIASARLLRIDFDPAKPVNINELNGKLSKSSNYTQRMALKKNLFLLGCL
jgi:hypothetical protein